MDSAIALYLLLNDASDICIMHGNGGGATVSVYLRPAVTPDMPPPLPSVGSGAYPAPVSPAKPTSET